ncbi:MAG TPA: T9SS type A sorting domain-containing protein, partial [Bacteroidia bacterium]|nr:T9SS type A sorting domain-containing protein [Bacteroidia bacterium]
ATTIPQMLARFDTYAPPLGPAANECPNNTYNTLPMLNNGYWTIAASANPTSGIYTTTLYSTNYSNSGGAAGWTVAKGTSTATFLLDGTCAASTAATTVRTGMNGFSVFGVAQSVAPLPVELVAFSGVSFDDHNHLDWVTASEMNNDYFNVERSDDGVNFHTIGTVDGSGNSTQHIEYPFNDYSPIEGINYYRLKQVDFNGAVTYSNIVALEFHRGNMSVANVKPNPTNGEVNFDFFTPVETTIHVVITDVTGRVVRDEYKSVKAGANLVNTMIEDQAAGIYSMTVTEEQSGFRSVNRIVKY